MANRNAKKEATSPSGGHMQIDKIASRRAAVIDLLADGRAHLREEIWETVAAQLGMLGVWRGLREENQRP